MKRLIYLTALVLLCTRLCAQVKLYPKAQFAYEYTAYKLRGEVGNNSVSYHYPRFCARTGLELKYKRLSVYYDTKIYMREQGVQFAPKQAIFEIGASYEVIRNVKVGIMHNCYHPIRCDENALSRAGMYGGATEISVSYGY